jgi:hypothetical protein
MKTRLLLLSTFCAILVSCAPAGKNGEQKNGNPNSPGPQETRPNKPPSPKPDDVNCGTEIIKNCELFGLSDRDLMNIRVDLPASLIGKGENNEVSENLKTALQSARLWAWVKTWYPKAQFDFSDDEMKKYLEFFKSIQWGVKIK